jgi:branched-chain amino acid transport system ATP-binding protein
MMLEVAHVAVDHGRLRALWDVSLGLAENECIGLLGANGAGKSTTLGAILGIYPPAAGSIRYRGQSINKRAPAHNVSDGIALVAEGRRLFSDMSVIENLMMGAYPRHVRGAAKTAVERCFTLFPALKTKRDQPAGSLSGGQQQMLAIARALMSSPRLLLLDEPFLGVAPIIVDEVMTALRAIGRDGVAMILVEQNIHRALNFVERAYVIENGRTVLEGTKQSLLDDPAFSSKFLGLD